MRDHFKDSADGIARAIRVIDRFFHARFDHRIDTAEKHLFPPVNPRDFFPSGGTLQFNRSNAHHVTQHFDPEFAEKCFRQSAKSDAGGSFAGAGALQDIAGFGEIVLDRAR